MNRLAAALTIFVLAGFAALTLASCSGVTPLPYRPATTWAQAEANCVATGRTRENCACTGANLSKAVSFERYRDLTAASARVFPVKKTKDEQPMSPNEFGICLTTAFDVNSRLVSSADHYGSRSGRIVKKSLSG